MELKRLKLTHTTAGNNLLIVPYGIETAFKAELQPFKQTFNRTLWN